MKSLAETLVSYCLVGFSGVVVDMSAFLALHSLGEFSLLAAKLAAGGIAILNNFAWNELFTFRHRREPGERAFAFFRRYATFNLISAVGLGISACVLLFLARIGFTAALANLTAIGITTALNFTLNNCITWRRRRASKVSPPIEPALPSQANLTRARIVAGPSENKHRL